MNYFKSNKENSLKEKELKRGKRKYQERLVEEAEAEKEIKQYIYEELDPIDNDEQHPITH